MNSLIFLRHAERGHGIEALTTRGVAQADALAQLIPKELPFPTLLLCSPKPRAKATLQTLGKRFSIEPTVDLLLDERSAEESSSNMSSRIKKLLSRIQEDDEQKAIYVCSHSDWLHEAMIFLPSTLSDSEIEQPWTLAEARHFKKNRDGLWVLAQRIINPLNRTSAGKL